MRKRSRYQCYENYGIVKNAAERYFILMATIRYSAFQFQRPDNLTERDYKILKDLILANSKVNINPRSSFIQTFKPYLKLWGICGIVLAIAGAYEHYFGLMPRLVEEWVGAISALIAIFSFLSFVPSFCSYTEYLKQKADYYSQLYKDVANSLNYSEFLSSKSCS